MARHDVLVVGGGLGGLAAAVGLARSGRSVLVLEGKAVAGGYAANFERGDWRFDASLHMLDAVEPGCANRRIWSYLGLDARVPTAVPEDIRAEVWPEHRFQIGQGMAAWIDALATEFPDERAGLRAVADLAIRVHDAVMADRDANLDGAPLAALDDSLGGLLDLTAGPVLRRYLRDPRLVAIAGSLSCYLGLGCDELAAIPFFTMLSSYHHHSGSYPVGGSGAIAAALVAELESLGGELRLHTPVAAIRSHHRQVRGVRLESGEELDASWVISNVSPIATYLHLLDSDQVDRRFRGRISRAPLGTSVLKAWLGVPRELAAQVPYESFLRTRYGTTFCDGTLEDIGVVVPHHLDPACAPEHGAVVAITAGAEARLGEGDQERYRALAEEAIRQVDQRLLPGLIEGTEVKLVATPSTFHRYTSNPGGTIHGFRPIPSQSGPRRLGIRGPISNLYNVGGWTYAGSGFLPAMTSGLMAASAICGGLP